MLDEERRHLPGECWCDINHHCCHLNQNADDPSSEEICCWCGAILPIIKIRQLENHGPHAWWIYIPKKVNPEDDVCLGKTDPPVRVLPPDAHDQRRLAKVS